MSISYQIDENISAIHVVGRDRVTDEGLLEFARAVRADPALKPNQSALIDFTGVERLDVTPGGLRELVDYMVTTRDLRGDAKQAFVVKKTGMALIVDLFSMSSAGAGLNSHIQLFQNIADALDWLEIDEDAFLAA